MEREKATSPTTMMESVMITATSDTKKRPRNVMTADVISNAFGQVDIGTYHYEHLMFSCQYVDRNQPQDL